MKNKNINLQVVISIQVFFGETRLTENGNYLKSEINKL